MASLTTDPQSDKHQVILTWSNVEMAAKRVVEDLRRRHMSPIRLWGIPRGGVYAALLIKSLLHQSSIPCEIVEDMHDANVIVDDIIQTGNTWKKVENALGDEEVLFYALYDKTQSSKEKRWLVFPWEHAIMETGPEENIVRVLEFLGEDPMREGLLETPSRVIRSWSLLYGGYHTDPHTVLKTFEEDSSDEMIVLRNVEFYSTCEHHMLPFFGKAHIAYIPNGRVVGVSKLARLLEVFARRLQIQERICQQITHTLMEVLNPLGAACLLEAQHFCMTSRGVQKQSSVMVTSSLEGVFKTDSSVRQEFLSLVRG